MTSSKTLFVLLAALLVSACSTPNTDDSNELDEIRTEISAIRESLSTTTSLSGSVSSPTTSPPPANSPTTSPPATAPPTTVTVPSTTVPSTTMPPSGPEFPPEIGSLEHGQDVWVVVLAASEGFGDPALQTAVLAAEAAGYFTGPTDCDAGAAQALGLPDDGHYYTVSVYFDSEADANAARDAFAARGTGGTVAEVQAFCLD